MGYRYIGSKEKLSASIIKIFKEECPRASSVVDLMAGTGLFSRALRRANYKVIASDVMTFSYHHLIVNLLLNKNPFFLGLKNILPEYSTDNPYASVLSYLNNVRPKEGFFYREYSPSGNPLNGSAPRCYFTSENAKKIDALRSIIKTWHDGGKITDIEHSLLLHTLILSANDVANIAGTYGHYLSHFVKRATDPIILLPIKFDDNENIIGHEIYRGYAEDLAPFLKGDICYIDPPYIKRQYAANYHILETLAREDCPELSGKSGLRPWREQYSNFCSKLKIFDSFNIILSTVASKDFFISYSSEGLIPIETLTTFFVKFGRVDRTEIEYKRFKSHDDDSPNTVLEYLIHIKKI